MGEIRGGESRGGRERQRERKGGRERHTECVLTFSALAGSVRVPHSPG